MTVTELIEKHYWGEHDRDKARQFAIELLEKVKAECSNECVAGNVDRALEELRGESPKAVMKPGYFHGSICSCTPSARNASCHYHGDKALEELRK